MELSLITGIVELHLSTCIVEQSLNTGIVELQLIAGTIEQSLITGVVELPLIQLYLLPYIFPIHIFAGPNNLESTVQSWDDALKSTNWGTKSRVWLQTCKVI